MNARCPTQPRAPSIKLHEPMAAIVGVGVDLVHIPRIRILLQRQAGRIRARRGDDSANEVNARDVAMESFAGKILHAKEFERWSALNKVNDRKAGVSEEQVRHLAKVWSAKEAAFKAISSLPHPRPLVWHDAILAYVKGTRRPILQYTPELLQCWRQADLQPRSPPKLHLSISHDGEYVTSFVVAEIDR